MKNGDMKSTYGKGCFGTILKKNQSQLTKVYFTIAYTLDGKHIMQLKEVYIHVKHN